jgi:hypothetical protein
MLLSLPLLRSFNYSLLHYVDVCCSHNVRDYVSQSYKTTGSILQNFMFNGDDYEEWRLLGCYAV